MDTLTNPYQSLNVMRTEVYPCKKIAICVATYKRPELLARLLKSLEAITPPSGYSLELRIVDNDSERSAELQVSRFREYADLFFDVLYTVQSKQNIALARNTALDMGHADFVLFVDDDEEVAPDWIAQLLAAAEQSSADAVFGPVEGRFHSNTPRWIQRSNFFHKPVEPTGTRIDWKQTRTSNTLVKGNWFYNSKPNRFDPSLGRSGGSDSNLFSRLEKQGARFSTCQSATAWEDVPDNRANLKWLMKRWYRNGLIYERIARANETEISPLKRLARRCAAAALYITRGLPALAIGKPETSIRGLLRLSLALGGLKEWIRPDSVENHVHYRKASESKVTNPKTKLAFLTNIVSPYRAPVFKELAKSHKLTLFVDAETEFDRNWKVDTNNLAIKKPATISIKRTVTSAKPIPFKQVITLHLPIGLFFSLAKSRPEKVISHELGLRTAVAAFYCFLFRKPLVIWAYQSRISSQQGGWRNSLRRFLLSRAERVVGMGIQAREVLKTWGVSEEKIIDAPNAANHSSIEAQLASCSANQRINEIREKHSAGKKLAIVVGRLIPLKGTAQILEAWQNLPQDTRDKWNLLFVGSGPLSRLVKEANDPQIQQVEDVSPDSIAYYYAAADLHVFPTCGDVWGLVVNEASHCGTPTLCSPFAGCADDLIADDQNGLTADFTEPQKAAQQLERALKRKDLISLGVAARHHAKKYTVQNLAQSFADAIR